MEMETVNIKVGNKLTVPWNISEITKKIQFKCFFINITVEWISSFCNSIVRLHYQLISYMVIIATKSSILHICAQGIWKGQRREKQTWAIAVLCFLISSLRSSWSSSILDCSSFFSLCRRLSCSSSWMTQVSK